jgi:hypothetical protein
LSYRDLEFCELTELALKKFAGEVTADRHMVEYREDKSMELTKPTRSRSERDNAKRAKKNNGLSDKQRNSGNETGSKGDEEIILID